MKTRDGGCTRARGISPERGAGSGDPGENRSGSVKVGKHILRFLDYESRLGNLTSINNKDGLFPKSSNVSSKRDLKISLGCTQNV